MNCRDELPVVLYRFDHVEDCEYFVTAFQDSFKLLICDNNREAQQAIEEYGERIDTLILDQDKVDDSLSSLCKTIKPDLLSIQLHQDIALDEIVSLLDNALIDRCFAKPYDINIIRSEIYTSAMGINSGELKQAAPDNSSQQYSVLIVDDEKIATKFLSKQLKRLACPCEIFIADDAEQALHIFSEQKDNLAIIISDQRMPGITGNQLLNEIQKYSPHIIRMLTSAYEEVDIALNAVNEGRISRYIKKPWNAEEVNAIIKLSLLEFQSRISQAKAQDADINQQYQEIIAQRQVQLSLALTNLFEGSGGEDSLAIFFGHLKNIQTLQANKASLRASQETDIEKRLVSGFVALVQSRMLQISTKVVSPYPSEKFLDLVPQLIEADSELSEELIQEACVSDFLDVEILRSLQQLLQTSGLDFSALMFIENETNYVLKTKENVDLSLYRHILSAHIQLTDQMLQQQCEMLMLIITCQKLAITLQLKEKELSFSLSITYSK